MVKFIKNKNEYGEEGIRTVLDPEMAAWAYNFDLLSYVGNYDRSGNVEAKGSALLYLALGEYQSPSDGVIKDKILESVRFFIKGGNEPGFNAGPNHSYPPVALALAVIRHTPTVWGALTKAEHTNELIKDGQTHLRIDYKVSGLGSNSCGPQLAEEYRVNEKKIKFNFTIKPI